MDIQKPDNKLCKQIVASFKEHVFDESFDRLKRCIDHLTEKEIWYSHNEHINSVGNLILHLCGNARQYIISGIGGAKDNRKRQEEFDSKNVTEKAALKQMLDDLKVDLMPVLEQIEPTTLIEVRKVQGFEKSVLSILIHVIEHFSYHTGQVTYLVKLIKNIDTGYYAGIDLNITE